MSCSINSNTKSQQWVSIQIQNFENHNNTHKSYYLQYLLAVCYACTVQRLSLPPTDCSHTFLKAIQKLMPHWTPSQSDDVVYATIEEALSGSIVDVESYLSKVKRDLHIGQPGYPDRIVIAGDQQTFALMKKYSSTILIITNG